MKSHEALLLMLALKICLVKREGLKFYENGLCFNVQMIKTHF